MTVDFWELYLLAFTVVAGGNALLASWTSLFYRRKAWGQLKPNELKVKQGTADLEVRLDLFVRTFFACFFSHQIYLLALALSGGVYLLIR